MTSVSVWLWKANPSASSSRRRAAWFSITPLWTTATAAAVAAAEVGMGVAVGGRAVGGPARVADPARARARARARAPPPGRRTRPARFRTYEPAAVEGREPGAVVAAVLQPPQAGHQDRAGLVHPRCIRRSRTSASLPSTPSPARPRGAVPSVASPPRSALDRPDVSSLRTREPAIARRSWPHRRTSLVGLHQALRPDVRTSRELDRRNDVDSSARLVDTRHESGRGWPRM